MYGKAVEECRSGFAQDAYEGSKPTPLSRTGVRWMLGWRALGLVRCRVEGLLAGVVGGAQHDLREDMRCLADDFCRQHGDQACDRRAMRVHTGAAQAPARSEKVRPQIGQVGPWVHRSEEEEAGSKGLCAWSGHLRVRFRWAPASHRR